MLVIALYNRSESIDVRDRTAPHPSVSPRGVRVWSYSIGHHIHPRVICLAPEERLFKWAAA